MIYIKSKNKKNSIEASPEVDTITISEENKIKQKNSLYDYYVKDITKNDYNCFSYGKLKGNFNIPNNMFHLLCTDKYICENFAIVEKKTEFYMLIYDIDYKPKVNEKGNINKYFDLYDTKENEITDIIIMAIQKSLLSTFNNPNVSFLFLHKNNNSKGVHLYYPSITVNNELSKFIYDKIIIECQSQMNLSIDCWKKIVDACTTSSNGLRLPYFYKDGSYYEPNFEKSTYIFPENVNKKDITKLCLIRTNKTYCEPELLNNTVSSTIKIKNSVKKTIINDNVPIIIDDNIDKIDNIIKTDDIELIKKLLLILSIKRIDDFECWKNIICLCKNYGLKDDAICISKKSDKFDNNSLKIINDIFKKKYTDNKLLKIGSLIKWCKEDNEILTSDLLRQHFLNSIQLKINNVDDFLLYNYKDSYDMVINSNKIYDEYIDKICEKIGNDNVRTVLIQSPTDSGKTTCFMKIINYYIDNFTDGIANTNILSIVTRRSMIATHKNSFDKLKLISYRDVGEFKNKYIASMEKLYYYNNHDYQIVILDEINSMINYIYSGTLEGKRLKCYINLCKIIKSANLVLCCDSNATSMVHSFINTNKSCFGNVFKLRNISKNKSHVKMTIYNSKCHDLKQKLKYYTSHLIDDVKQGKSVIIFSDSKDITDSLYAILSEYNNTKGYCVKINKNWGTEEELENFDKIYVNKCVIISPKIIYGLNILIQYHNVYCFYKHTTKEKAMGALEYHQQYSRCRNAKHIHIFDMNPYYETSYNFYINFNDHVQNEKELFKNKLEKYNEYNASKSIEPLISKYEDADIVIDTEKSFTNVHFYKTWYDKLFSRNKIQLVSKLAEQAGYTINYITDNISDTCTKHINLFKKQIKTDNEHIEEIYDAFINNDTISEEHKRMYPNVIECINQRIKLLGNNAQKDIVLDNKKFNAIINKKYLDMTFTEYNIIRHKIISNDIPQLGLDNRLIYKIDMLYDIEELLEIKRYALNDINKKNLNKYIKNLLDINNKLHIFGNETNSIKKNINMIKKRIEKIERIDQLQKLLADFYNTLGNIIEYKKKLDSDRIIIYYKFNLV